MVCLLSAIGGSKDTVLCIFAYSVALKRRSFYLSPVVKGVKFLRGNSCLKYCINPG